MKKFIAFLLCAALILTGCAPRALTGKVADMQGYADTTVFDATEYEAMLPELEALCAGQNCSDALELFGQLDSALQKSYGVYSYTSVMYSEDVTDADASRLQTDAYSAYLRMETLIKQAGHLMAVTFGEDFRTYLGDDWYYDLYLDYTELSDEAMALEEQLNTLTQDYYAVDEDSFTHTYGGTAYCLSDLEDCGLSEDVTSEIHEDCMRQYNEAVGEIYLQMVAKRTQLAKHNGYDNYAAYADAEKYYRDYTEDDLQKFYRGVKPVAALYQPFARDDDYLCSLEITPRVLKEKLDILAETMPEAEQAAYARLIADGLLIVGDEEQGMPGAYSDGYTCDNQNHALIYTYTYHDYSCVDNIVHELGHFTDIIENGLHPLQMQSIDVAEIHSTGSQALSVSQYPRILPEREADLLRAYILNDYLYLVVYACIYDEWQRLVYKNPDMTLAEINEAYRTVALAYGREDTPWLGYEWTGKRHNFEVPMYYMSYGASAVVAMQLYRLEKEDRDAAMTAWETVLECSTDSPYLATVSRAGLIPFTDTEYTVSLFRDIAGEIQDIQTKYGLESAKNASQ